MREIDMISSDDGMFASYAYGLMCLFIRKKFKSFYPKLFSFPIFYFVALSKTPKKKHNVFAGRKILDFDKFSLCLACFASHINYSIPPVQSVRHLFVIRSKKNVGLASHNLLIGSTFVGCATRGV